MLLQPTNQDGHPLNGLFDGTISVSWHPKGKTILDYNESREDGVVVASSARHFRQITNKPHKTWLKTICTVNAHKKTFYSHYILRES